MLKTFLILTSILGHSTALAADDAVIKIINTESTGEKFESPGTKTVYQVGPNSKLKIEYQAKKEKAELYRGSVRIRVKKNSGEAGSKKEPKFQLKTISAIMGVRGTDFLATTSPLLDESEIVVFEGIVDFTSLMDQKDTRTVNAGQWGGIGGRFGITTHELINLPATALKHFDTTSTIESEKTGTLKKGR
jgi:hypothetical protein